MRKLLTIATAALLFTTSGAAISDKPPEGDAEAIAEMVDKLRDSSKPSRYISDK